MIASGWPQRFRGLGSLHWRFVLVAAIASLIGIGRAPTAVAARLRDPAATELDAALALLGGKLPSTDVAAAASVAGKAVKSGDAEGGVFVGGEDYDSDDRGASLSPAAIDGQGDRGRAELGGGGAAAAWRRGRLLFGSREHVERGAQGTAHGAALGAFFGYSNGAIAHLRKAPGCAHGQFAGEQAATACRLSAGSAIGGRAHSGAERERERAAIATRRPTVDLKRWNNAVMRLWGKRGGGGVAAAAGIRDVYDLDSLASAAS